MKKVLMLVYSSFPEDTRVRREAYTLTKNGFAVDVICLLIKGSTKNEVFEGVNIFRINLKNKRGSLINYIYLYFTFFIVSFFKLNFLYFKKKYDVIHVHNMPNFLVFAALFPKIFGAKIILDLHDPSPEVLLSITNKSDKSFFFKLLVIEEKLSIWLADKVITTNIAFKNLFISRGCPSEKIIIVMNSPQLSIFNNLASASPVIESKSKDKFRIMYHGTIIKRHGLDILIDAIRLLIDKIPEIELNIFGGGDFLSEVLEKVKLLNLENVVKYKGLFLIDKIAEEIPKMDVGVIPNRFNVFTNLNFPIRVFEFIHFKKPIIVPYTRGIRDYFDDNSIFYFRPEDPQNLAEVILSVFNKDGNYNEIINRSFEIYKKNAEDSQAENLLKLYETIKKYK